jgi:hypothetical protein
MQMSRYARWHGQVVWLGIILNLLLVLPLVVAPSLFLGLLHIPLEHTIWARIAGLLLFIITIFYVPSTWDLQRYRVIAWFAVFPSRTWGAVFYLVAVFVFGHPKGFLIGALVDGVIGSMTFILLLLVTREEKLGAGRLKEEKDSRKGLN